MHIKLSTNSSLGFYNVLAIMFIGLKLTNYIDWSWWFVLAPLWGQVVLMLLIALLESMSSSKR